LEKVLQALQLTLNKTSGQTKVSLRKQAEAESARSGSTVVELMSTFPIADFVLMFDVVFGDHGGA
jgi:hypothetical protein